ncbi:MAG TPA: mechanosensitive ion channel family protein [Candidatus Saccharimonadales bacterium]|nr:mechanosensitive ion channel family protein [Candidatus Saccharimonadales bacterium]
MIEAVKNTLNVWFAGNEPLKLIFVMIVTAIVAYWLSKFIANSMIWVARKIAGQSDATSSEERFIQLRRVETYLSISVALVRFGVVVAAVLLAWLVLSDNTSSNANAATAIGAGAIFAVLAGATIGPLLRDITSGATMIIERWFDVGDFVQIDPFADVKGVVERLTLRSTRIRNISGEVIWLHNQHIQGVRVTPRGVRTMAIDIFVNDVDQAKKSIEKLIKTLQAGPTMLATPLHVVETEKLASDFWRLTFMGQTAPGREWLIENFFVEALKTADKRNPNFGILYGPLVRYADAEAERRFRRAVRVQQFSANQKSSKPPTPSDDQKE